MASHIQIPYFLLAGLNSHVPIFQMGFSDTVTLGASVCDIDLQLTI